jgi:hypothetical protein
VVSAYNDVRLEGLKSKWGEGRDLDASIAIARFGYQWAHLRVAPYRADQRFLMPHNHILADPFPAEIDVDSIPRAESQNPVAVQWHSLVPRFNDWAGIGKLIDKMREEGWRFELETSAHGNHDYAEFSHTNPALGGKGWCLSTDIFQAIAYAALEAMDSLSL